MIRFYDKYKERINKGYALNETITFWQRTEIQLRHERANKAIRTLVNTPDELGGFICGILRRYLDFKIKGPDTHKDRWKTTRWWTTFLGQVEKVYLSENLSERTILRTKDWIDSQVAGSVATLYEAFNDDNLFLDYLLKLGKSKMTAKQSQLATDFKLSLNQQLMVKEQMKTSLKDLTDGLDKHIYIDHAERQSQELTQQQINYLQQKEHALQLKYKELIAKESQLNQLISRYGALNSASPSQQSTLYNIYYVN